MDKDEVVQIRTFSGINFIFGSWLVASPYLLGYASSAARWTQITFGVFILILTALRFIVPRLEWASWFVGLCGLWLIVAPFMLNYELSIAYWNEVIAGIIISTLAFWNMDTYTGRYHHPV